MDKVIIDGKCEILIILNSIKMYDIGRINWSLDLDWLYEMKKYNHQVTYEGV
jgi:hypothetical protein